MTIYLSSTTVYKAIIEVLILYNFKKGLFLTCVLKTNMNPNKKGIRSQGSMDAQSTNNAGLSSGIVVDVAFLHYL